MLTVQTVLTVLTVLTVHKGWQVQSHKASPSWIAVLDFISVLVEPEDADHVGRRHLRQDH